MKRRKRKSCREEVLAAAQLLSEMRADRTFSMQDVIDVMRAEDTEYLDVVIRRHVSTHMCVNASGAQAAVVADLERVTRGRYRLFPPVGDRTN